MFTYALKDDKDELNIFNFKIKICEIKLHLLSLVKIWMPRYGQNTLFKDGSKCLETRSNILFVFICVSCSFYS